jgi:hypothetical protein
MFKIILKKAQKPIGPMPEGQEMKKRIDNTILNSKIKTRDMSLPVMESPKYSTLVLGFMTFNDYLDRQPLVFFTGDSKTIHDEI